MSARSANTAAAIEHWLPFDQQTFATLDPRSKRWISRETIRRSTLDARDHCPAVLLSYPRSGNHLLRFLVESVTRRPTLGAIDHERLPTPVGLHDLPIYLRVRGLSVTKPSPILVKRHSLLPDDSFQKTILLVREPIEAILSHLKHESDEDFEKKVHREVSDFTENLRAYNFLPAAAKLTVDYSELTTDPLASVQNVVSFLGHSDPLLPLRIRLAINKRTGAYKSLKRPHERDYQTYRDVFPHRAKYLQDLL